MDPSLAAGLASGAAILLAAIALVVMGWLARGRSAVAELALERGQAERAEALAEHRRGLLVAAAERALAKAGGAAADATAEAKVGAALAGATGDVDAAVDELLRAAHDDRGGPDGKADAPGPAGSPASDERGATGVGDGAASGPPRG